MISLGSLFSRDPAPLLGIDVSSSSVKLVELGRNRSGDLVLERCAIEPLERGWITDGNIEKFDEVAEAVRRVVNKSGSKTKNVVPPSGLASKLICPPWASTMFFTTGRPNPVPRPAGLVVKNGSKTRFWSCSRMPSPLSATASPSHDSPSRKVRTVTFPPAWIAPPSVVAVFSLTVLFVTHSLAEAAFLSDAIVLMTPRPGRIARIIPVPLPRPRVPEMRLSDEFAALVAELNRDLYRMMA